MKLLSCTLGLAAGMAILLAGCSKDGNSTNPVTTDPTPSPLVGNWTVISGAEGRKYMVFKADNTYDFLNEYAYGLRGMDNGVYQVSGGEVDFGWYRYAYTIRNDTLILSSPQHTITSCRTPATQADSLWVKSAVILDSVAAPIPTLTDVSVQGDTLWYGNAQSSNHLFKITLSTHSVDTSRAITLSAWAVEWDGNHLWCSDDSLDSIFRLNTATGTTAFTSRQMGAWIYGIAWDGSALWCSSNGEESLYRYRPNGNVVIVTLWLGVQPSGLAFANGHLYVCVGGVINVCETTPFRTVAAYRVPNADTFGIASDGTNFWVSCDTGGTSRIYKVTMP